MLGVFEWVIENPEIGWVLVILYLGYEIRGPGGVIHKLHMQISQTAVVVRALARVHESIETEQVDDVLSDNGNEPSDYIDFGHLSSEDRQDDKELIDRGDD